MTTPSSNPTPAVAAGAFVAAGLTEDEARDARARTGGETVGASDADADRARAAGEPIPADAARDDDGVPVGQADAEEDARRSGADPDAA
jgi:hypothetical protein